ncbi:hypothetical protein [Stappia indica]|uniref:hypothetical protein n=1 Tax=Stappia indica TaxID=538381 RepID=UPI00082A13CE|nr:hypothetical protein [Stappia indica]
MTGQFDDHQTAANVRGDIQKGRTGDKVPGFDPAAAPMETDAEAAGTQPPPPSGDARQTAEAASTDTTPPYAYASSNASAMRPFDRQKPKSSVRMVTVAMIAAAVVALLVVAAIIW